MSSYFFCFPLPARSEGEIDEREGQNFIAMAFLDGMTLKHPIDGRLYPLVGFQPSRGTNELEASSGAKPIIRAALWGSSERHLLGTPLHQVSSPLLRNNVRTSLGIR
jgi:hypothetical protein